MVRIVEAKATYYTEEGEAYMTVDFLKWDRRVFLSKLWWVIRCWRRLDLKVAVEKKAAVGES